MKQLEKDQFYPYKKGLRKCDRKMLKMRKTINELNEEVKNLKEQNKKYFDLLDKLGRVEHTKVKACGFVFDLSRVIF